METFLNIILDILSILAIIVFGSLVVVVVADLILCMFDGQKGVIFRRNGGSAKDKTSHVKKEDIVVYSNLPNQNLNEPKKLSAEYKPEMIDGHKVQPIDFDKAVEEQKLINNQKIVTPPSLDSRNQASRPEPIRPQPARVPKPAPKPMSDNLFLDPNEEDEFGEILDEIFGEANKKSTIKKKDTEIIVEIPDKVNERDKELQELKKIKEEQQREVDEFKKLKEDFDREKEEQLAMLKSNFDKVKSEEIELIKQEVMREQKMLEDMRKALEEEKQKLTDEKKAQQEHESKVSTSAEKTVIAAEKAMQAAEKVVEVSKTVNEKTCEVVEPIVKETIIKDEEEINKLKFKNLMRMNARLTRIIRDTEKLQDQKQKEQAKMQLERQRLMQKEQEELLNEKARRLEIQRRNQEILRVKQENLRKKNEISKKLIEVNKRASKYSLDSKIIKITPVIKERIEEIVVASSEQSVQPTNQSKIIKSGKPLFEKSYYIAKFAELEKELSEAERELRANKSEYIPLTRIYRSFERDSDKLRKKEIQIAKQKIAMYGVNTTKVDPAKKAKLDENLKALMELKSSVDHCEEIIKKNKDRYPVLEKNNQLITKTITRIQEDIKLCKKALAFYDKKDL